MGHQYRVVVGLLPDTISPRRASLDCVAALYVSPVTVTLRQEIVPKSMRPV
jgi:hypothetical protein